MESNNHIILYYKGDISALTLFCQHKDGHICFPPLPALSEVTPEGQRQPLSVNTHPAPLIKQLNRQLQLDSDLLAADPGYYQQVETGKGIATVYMARFRLLDPPHKLMEARECKMQPLTALIGRPPAEMELLRRAYTQVMES